jgi:hypothetical protein
VHQSPAPSPSPWPTYAAKDYAKAVHPALTQAQIASIRRMLARVRPCERSLLRYAFTSNGGHFIMFFDTGSGEDPHVLGERNIYYQRREGRGIPVMGDGAGYSLQADIDKVGCVDP